MIHQIGYSKVCAFSCNSSKSKMVPVIGSFAFTTNDRISCLSCFRSICRITKSAVYYHQSLTVWSRLTSNTFVRPSLMNFGSGITFNRGINQGIPSNYHQFTPIEILPNSQVSPPSPPHRINTYCPPFPKSENFPLTTNPHRPIVNYDSKDIHQMKNT